MQSPTRTTLACLKASMADARNASRMSDRFFAWRLVPDDPVSVPLECDAATLADAITQAAPRCNHKDTLFVLQARPDSKTAMLHTYAIKQGKRIWFVDPETKVGRWFAPLKPVELFAMNVVDFAPEEPWRWTPGCDVVGIDRDLVEARR